MSLSPNTSRGGSGGATVTNSLPTVAKTAGAQALVRCGASPYDFVLVSYDSTYAKWVSNAVLYCGAFTIFSVSTSGQAWGLAPTRSGGAVVGIVPNGFIPYAGPLAAGLTLQARMTSLVAIAAGTATIDLATQTCNIGGTYNASVPASGMAQTSTSAAGILKDSGWVDLTPGASADFVILEPSVKSSGGSEVTLTTPTCWYRWVG